ncbi:hypothetical protein [Spirosoma endophyticum]|uniref:Uncharacterized protein n=1 Tax=Spirosoma endophyticum TaxID=662367 RepID=A0A1I1L2S9_9BACT|nr:hypothetical protein [Spirosoma endophyticum]SFC67235.1 hypothetical protein SAMN05216167_102115 [Spirosoma endophyticum]
MPAFQAQRVYFILFRGALYKVQAQSPEQLIADFQAIYKAIKNFPVLTSRLSPTGR